MIILLGNHVFSNEEITLAADEGGKMVLKTIRPLGDVNSHTLSQVINLLTEETIRKETEHGSSEESETV